MLAQDDELERRKHTENWTDTEREQVGEEIRRPKIGSELRVTLEDALEARPNRELARVLRQIDHRQVAHREKQRQEGGARHGEGDGVGVAS